MDSIMPVVFSGHGSPMIALEDNEVTRGMARTGREIAGRYGRPKAILAVSAHWYTAGTFVQTAEEPEQIYDMHGFPRELYEVEYPAKGCRELSGRVLALLGGGVRVNDEWGVDHGTWTVLKHMFPEADIPVVQLSVDRAVTGEKAFAIGQELAPLREEGYLIFGSGNVVHNLRRVEWDNPGGTEMTVRFNRRVIDAVLEGRRDEIIRYEELPDAAYAVPTPDHYLPLLYCLGAAEGDEAAVFNDVCDLGSMAMTGFVFSRLG